MARRKYKKTALERNYRSPQWRRVEISLSSSDDEESEPEPKPEPDWDVLPSDDDADSKYREFDGFQYEDAEDNNDSYGPMHDPVKRAEWFESLKTEFTGDSPDGNQWRIQKGIDFALISRFQHGQPWKSIKGQWEIMKFMLFIDGGKSKSAKVAILKRLKTFFSSNVLQKEFVYRMGLSVKPEKLNIKGHCVGYKVDLTKLSGIMLKNESLLKSLVNEQKLIDDTLFTEYNSEMTCNAERRNRLLGKLRFAIGIEEYDLSKDNGAKRKYFMFYVCFMNIPLEERLNDKGGHLIFVVSESKLRQNGLTVQDVVKAFADELKVMEVDGVDVELLNDGDELPEMVNIKGALVAVCPSQMAMHEMFGHRKPCSESEAFNCHFCAATEEEIQDFHNHRPLLGTNADLKDYDQCLLDIVNYEQKMKMNKKAKIDEGEDVDNEVEKAFEKAAHSAKVDKNRFDVSRGCPFTALSGVNIWNISPPNVIGDIADGVIGPLMAEFILVHAIKDLSGEEIATKLRDFEFGCGKIKVKFENGKFALSKEVKTGQKLELLSRLGEIFPDNLNLDHKGYKLFETLQSFTKLALSFSISLDDIPKLNLHSQTLIQLCLDLSSSFKVFPKLHELLHYSALTQLYGPLIYFAPLKNPQKDLLFYSCSYILCHCTSVTKTLMSRRQMLTALQLNEQKYLSVDLFANSNAQLATDGYDFVLKLFVERAKKYEQYELNTWDGSEPDDAYKELDNY